MTLVEHAKGELLHAKLAKPPLKILHTADVHLGDDYQPDLAKRAFLAVLDRATAEQVDVLVIAGDLFDSNRAARRLIDFALTELARVPMPVVLLPGNHDAYDATSVYREVNIRERCPNVHLLTEADGEVVHFPDLTLTLWGKPVVEHCPLFHPLGDIPERNGDGWYVAVAHGFHVVEDGETHRSSPISEDAIARSGWDYVALGHLHPYRDVSQGNVVACYAGSPVRATELQHSMGFVALVELHPENGVSVRPLPVVEQYAPWWGLPEDKAILARYLDI